MFTGPPSLRHLDDVSQAELRVDQLGQDDVAERQSEKQAQRVEDPGKSERDQDFEDQVLALAPSVWAVCTKRSSTSRMAAVVSKMTKPTHAMKMKKTF